MDYFPWQHDDEDDALAWIEVSPESIRRKDYLLTEGVCAAAWFPGGVTFDLWKDRGSKLADSIPNVLGFLIVSDKLRRLLDKHSGADIEFLPVRVRNHQGRLVKARYFIANVLGTTACVDRELSDFDMGAIDKEHASHFRRLVLDESRIGADQKLFRLSEQPGLILAREDLVDELLEQDCTGILFTYLEDFGAEFRD